MADFQILSVANGAEVVFAEADRFKTNEISLSFFTRLDEKTASANAVAVMLLSRCTREYPSILKLNSKLASLYGAQLEAGVAKAGELQMLKIGITSLDNSFALSNEDIAQECVSLLLSMAFEPVLDENGGFLQESVEREKRVIAEKIESENNEKRTYALRRAEEIMFEGEPYAVNRYGTLESVNALTAQEVLDAWKNIISSAKIVLTVVGNADAQKAKQALAEKLSSVERNYVNPPESVFKPADDNVKTVEERLNVNQGKLVMGFRLSEPSRDDKTKAAFRSFNDVFGGGPYSKLFANVREKMSLCYYCSSRYSKQKEFIIVQSGCEEENMEKAEKEILNQLEEIKKGNFDYEFASSKAGLTDAINSVNDTPEAIESWYSLQGASGLYKSPAESAKENNEVTKEQIIECAKRISLDTVYKLVSDKEGE